jgi:mannan endo-1,4-beta-mannosidase
MRALAVSLVLATACALPPVAELEREADCPDSEGAVPASERVMRRGVNSYFLQEEATRAVRAAQPTAILDEVFEKAAALEVSVIRTWAFNDAPDKIGDTTLQIDKLVYDEVALRGLDHVLAGAHARGISLVLTLGNYWDDYGGVRQYVAWAGLPDPEEGDLRFFTDAAIRAHFAQHITHLLSRISTVDGLRWADHPAVLYWELLNEPRVMDALLSPWFAEMGAAIHAIAPSARISSGQEGHTALPSGLDAESFHLFPESWGWIPTQIAKRGREHILANARRARVAGTSLVFGELGLRNEGAFDLDQRRALYRGWLRCAESQGASLGLLWMFANDARPDGWDLHTFYYRDGTLPEDPQNRYADLLLLGAP